MAVQLNHTIVHVRDRKASAEFLAELLGLDPPSSWGPFHILTLGNGVSLDFAEHDDPRSQHYAFLVSEAEFDQILGRIRRHDIPFWADPRQERPGEYNTNDGGRGLYWEDPNGHYLEIMTRPYGG